VKTFTIECINYNHYKAVLHYSISSLPVMIFIATDFFESFKNKK